MRTSKPMPGSVTKVNRYALGARGIDRVEVWDGTNTTYGYPLYDGHGNMRTTLGRNGTGYTTGTFKTYDVWGSVRSGGDSGDPTQKYCANLGHVSDSDSGLIYMRARYHEPSTGRFVSEDRARQGLNWYSYCRNSPTNFVDEAGNSARSLLLLFSSLFSVLAGFFFLGALLSVQVAIDAAGMASAYSLMMAANVCATLSLLLMEEHVLAAGSVMLEFGVKEAVIYYMEHCGVHGMLFGVKVGMETLAKVAVLATFAYSMSVLVLLSCNLAEEFFL